MCPSRLLSLDVFRGLTIALMIIVNSPGNPTPYYWLDHSPWDGCTLADLVFPFFIFIMGMSCVFSLSHAREAKRFLILKIIKRALLIFLIGVFLNAFPKHFDLSTLRFFGVLQRIALCYLFSALLYLKTKPKTQAIMMSVLLLGYWLLMSFPNFPLSPESNLAAVIDRSLLSAEHLYGKVYDPEGILSTIPAIATTLLGNLTAFCLMSHTLPIQKRNEMIFAGLLALCIGWLWGIWFPINKALWTSSYVLWTGGMALLVFSLCYWLVEIKKWKKWSKPFEIFGMNALAAYVLHVLFLKIQVMIPISRPNGTIVNLKIFLTEILFGWASAPNAALFYALSYTLLGLLGLSLLYRKKIFVKI